MDKTIDSAICRSCEMAAHIAELEAEVERLEEVNRADTALANELCADRDHVIATLEAESRELVAAGPRDFATIAAERMASAIHRMVFSGTLDARSPAADAALDFENPDSQRLHEVDGLRAQVAEFEGEIRDLRGQLDVPNQVDRIRAAGWAVAIHNDYLQDGHFNTFWLFTKGSQCVKGEGMSDFTALMRVEARIEALATPAPTEEDRG